MIINKIKFEGKITEYKMFRIYKGEQKEAPTEGEKMEYSIKEILDLTTTFLEGTIFQVMYTEIAAKQKGFNYV
jgi:hypothetical protein